MAKFILGINMYILANFTEKTYKIMAFLPHTYCHVKLFDEITQKEVIIWGPDKNKLFINLSKKWGGKSNCLLGYHFIKIDENHVSPYSYRFNWSSEDSELGIYRFKSFGLPKKDKHLKDEYIEYFI